MNILQAIDMIYAAYVMLLPTAIFIVAVKILSNTRKLRRKIKELEDEV